MKENDIRPSAFFSQYLKLSAKDAYKYFSNSIRKAVPCPACGKKKNTPAFEKLGFEFVVCDSCGTLFQSPRPSESDFTNFYKHSKSALFWANTFLPSVEKIRKEKLIRPKVSRLIQICQQKKFSPSTVIDAGAGHGWLLEELQIKKNLTQLIAIEPNHDSAEICRQKGFIVHESSVEDLTDQRVADLVLSFEVLEHVHNPLTFCQALHKLLKDNGRLLLTTLTVDGFDIRVLWNRSKSISPPHHINFLSIAGLNKLMERAGFKNIDIFTPGNLDVDIVKNILKEAPDIISSNSFLNVLLNSEEEVLENFQNFLKSNRLSSHCWIWAEKHSNNA